MISFQKRELFIKWRFSKNEFPWTNNQITSFHDFLAYFHWIYQRECQRTQEKHPATKMNKEQHYYLIPIDIITHENDRNKNTKELASSCNCWQDQWREMSYCVQNEHLTNWRTKTKLNCILFFKSTTHSNPETKMIRCQESNPRQ